MPEYAGFASLSVYLKVRCQTEEITFHDLSVKLGFAHTYIASVVRGKFVPQPDRADAIADYFGDDRRIVRILAGHELPPPDQNPTVAAIRDLAASLPAAGQIELLHYAFYLKHNSKNPG